MSIQARLLGAVVLAAAVLGAASFTLVGKAGERSARAAAERAIADSARALAAMEQAEVEKLDAALHALAAHPGLADAFAARDRERLLALARPIFHGLEGRHDVTHWYFLEPAPARTVFLRVHAPAQHGDVVNRATLRRAIETRGRGAGKELGKTAFALRVVRSYHGRDGKLLGYMELAEEIDHFLGRMKAQTGDDYGLLVEKAFLDEREWAGARAAAGRRNDWADRARTVVVDRTGDDPSDVDFDGDLSAVPDDGRLLEERERDGRVLARGIVAVKDAAGRRVGGLFVVHDVTGIHEGTLEVRRSMAWIVAGVSVAFAILLLLLVNRLVFARLASLTARMEDLSARIAGGDYSARMPAVGARDEIGRFERMLGAFLEVVTGLLKELGSRKAG